MKLNLTFLSIVIFLPILFAAALKVRSEPKAEVTEAQIESKASEASATTWTNPTAAPVVDLAVMIAQAALSAQAAARQAAIVSMIAVSIQTIAALGMAWIGYKQRLLSQSQKDLAKTVVTLEKHTNSIKDALILSTAESNRAKGNLEGRAELEAEHEQKDRYGG